MRCRAGRRGYLTFEHYTGSTTLSCPAGGGAVNCLAVTTSVYSRIAGIFSTVFGTLALTSADDAAG